MKQLLRFVTLGLLTGCLASHAQNFSGSDGFTGDSGYWGSNVAGGSVAGATFSLSGGVLNFTAPATTLAGDYSTVYRNWTLNAGSSAGDWQVQADFTVNPVSQVGGQFTSLTMIISNNTDNTDYAQLEFRKTYAGSNYFGSIIANNNTSTPLNSGTLGATVSTATLRASYLAATNVLTMAVNEGSGFTTVCSTVITGWTMTPGVDTFGLQILGSNTANAMPASVIGAGEVYLDNFLASPTAPIPEPSTYAAGIGALALLAAGLKRRFGQQ